MANKLTRQQQNDIARAYLLNNCNIITRTTGTTSGNGLGTTTRFRLQNYGLLTGLLVKVECQVDIGTAVAVLSDKGPFNLIKKLKLIDYSGKTRIDCSGEMLWAVNCIRRGTYATYNNESASSVYSNPVVPTAVGTAQSLSFFLEVPCAFDELRDLRGIIDMRTASGDMTLQIDWNPSLYTNGNADSVYKGAATSTVVLTAGYAPQINCEIIQKYYLPPMFNGESIWPSDDALTVYDITSWPTSDNLNAGAQKAISFPPGKNTLTAYVWYTNNGVCNPSTTDIARIVIQTNGAETIWDTAPWAVLANQRLNLNSDIRNGLMTFLSRKNPVDPLTFGNYQLLITPSVVTNTTYPAYLQVCWESLYQEGSVQSSPITNT